MVILVTIVGELVSVVVVVAGVVSVAVVLSLDGTLDKPLKTARCLVCCFCPVCADGDCSGLDDGGIGACYICW